MHQIVRNLSFALRWIDEHFEAREEFIGLHKVDQIDSGTIVAVLKDTLLRMNLKIENCRAGANAYAMMVQLI